MAPPISPTWLRYFMGVECIFYVILCIVNCKGAEIVTYGVPCPMKCLLPYTIEIPRLPSRQPLNAEAKECMPPLPIPIKETVRIEEPMEPRQEPPGARYPIVMEIPRAPVKPAEQQVCMSNLPRKSYGFSVQVPPALPETNISPQYSFGVEIVRPSLASSSASQKCIQPSIPPRFTDLRAKVDKILVPKCEYQCM